MTDESNNRPTAALAAIEAYLCNYEPDTGEIGRASCRE